MERVATFERRGDGSGDMVLILKSDERCIVDVDVGHIGPHGGAKGRALAHRIAAGMIEAGADCTYVMTDRSVVRFELVRASQVGSAVDLVEGVLGDLGFSPQGGPLVVRAARGSRS